MSVQKLQSKMQRQAGAILERVCIEFWTDQPNTLKTPVSVGLEFRNGSSFILSCAGDGRVALRKGRLETSSENLRLRSLAQLSGSALESVEFGDDRLVLSTADHRIQIVNYDDELRVTINDYDVKEVIYDSV